MLSHGYSVPKDDLTIIGFRNVDGRKDCFDDVIACCWYTSQDEYQRIETFKATTMPGAYWLEHLLNPKGTAILVPGYYPNCFKWGLHKGKPALVQAAPVSVYRDNKLNGSIDIDPKSIDVGMFGIDIHRAGWFSKLVGKWSAGCQVFQKEEDFEVFLKVVDRFRRNNINKKFSYSLVEFKYGL